MVIDIPELIIPILLF